MTVPDVHRPKAPQEAVELQQSHALGRGVGLLVQTRVVPEDQHLPVGDVLVLFDRIIVTEVSGGVQVSQQLADVREEPVLGIRLTWAGPTVREGKGVHLVLRDGSRVGGVAESQEETKTEYQPGGLEDYSWCFCNKDLDSFLCRK